MATKISEQEKKRAAKEFAAYWKGKGYEKGESQKFWIELLGNVYGIGNATRYIEFEDQVKMDNTSFIDGYISETKVLIEQKSIDKDLLKPIRQSNGEYRTPFQQAKNYSANLPYSRRPRWIITCNFKEFYIYDMENPNAEPDKLLLKDLPEEYYRLDILTNAKNEYVKKEMKVSIKAGELVGRIYDTLKKQYKDPDSPEVLRSLNILCVRLVFCLYAEDAGVFNRLSFYNYIKGHNPNHLRTAIIELFKVLNIKETERDEYLDEELKDFPWVNGGLFEDKEDEKVIIPQFTEELQTLLCKDASLDFDWSEISPTIFGAVFESTLNPETRHENGMHYTSIENIHKVIDPLFLNDLREELEKIKTLKTDKIKEKRLTEYCEKLGDLKFLDPACGSGNFLTETYLSLRTLENEALRIIHKDNIAMNLSDNPNDNIKVTIDQFYGIEINDFAVSVAKTALWIAENQMMKRTEEIIQVELKYLPLKTNAYIVEGNALRIDWNEVVNKNDLNYIMGNPPFLGYAKQSKEQKHEMISLFVDENGKRYNTAGRIDYVAGWYIKGAEFIYNTDIQIAFVSTSSITQGEQVSAVWKPLFDRFNIFINFCYRPFKWESEAIEKAMVTCVIIGFGVKEKPTKMIFDNQGYIATNYITPYLSDVNFSWIYSRNTPLNTELQMISGGKPVEDGNLIFTSKEKEEFLINEPKSEKYFKKFIGTNEFLKNRIRWCLWLKDVSPAELRNMPLVYERISKVKEYRLSSKKAATRECAIRPNEFMEIKVSEKEFIAVPEVSSEKRKYIPIGFLNSEYICSNKIRLIPEATLYHFGILTSNIHMIWTKTVCGRLGNGYSYSINIVYNNFPWCNPTDEQKAKIEKTAQAILDARALYPDSSLADLYDELTMPPELRKAHQENDRAVMQAYGFSTKMTESECVAELMKMYSKLTENK